MSELYIPRLRRISDTLIEMKRQDPNTVVTRHFIVDLIRRQEITAMKYGDAWLINLDELYGYFSGQKYRDAPVDKPAKRTICTTGEMLKLFREQDENTIIRKPNIRRFVKENEMVKVCSFNGKVFAVEPPLFVELEITDTEPGFKGDTATGATKPATVETGALVYVPLFVELGDKIKIDTRTGEYLSRV